MGGRQGKLALENWEPEFASNVLGIHVCGERFEAHNSGALYWPGEQTLIVSDLHLEQGASLASRGSLIPPYDTQTTLGELAVVLALYEPERVISLGDNFHDVAVAERLAPETLEEILELQAGREWFWITGNHDPHLPDELRGHVTPQLTLASIRFRHEPAEGAIAHEIAGHLHPAARVAKRGHTVRRKCFVTDGRRLVMPAFGAYTGGLNVLNESFAPLFPAESFQVWMLGRQDVYPVGKRYLLGD